MYCIVVKSVTQERHLSPETWSCEGKGALLKTTSHRVCWTDSTEFKKPCSIDELDQFGSGSVEQIVIYENNYYVQLAKYKPARYEVGGTWVVDTDDPGSCFMPLISVSEPLITGTLGALPNQLHFLNSKVTLSPIDAKCWLEHTNFI